jgi:hypothetical protein
MMDYHYPTSKQATAPISRLYCIYNNQPTMQQYILFAVISAAIKFIKEK